MSTLLFSPVKRNRTLQAMLHLVTLFLLWFIPANGSAEIARSDEKLQEAERLRHSGQLKEAEKLYKDILRFDEDSMPALKGLAAIAFELGDVGDVKEWNKKIIESHPNDLDARYALGIAYRESGKFKALLLRKLDFGKSEEHLGRAIALDSSYADVLYQRALLERYREEWTKAIALGHRQVALKPNLTRAHAGLYKLYRLLLHNKGDEEVAEWLAQQEGPWPAYFLGENHRENGRFAEADSVFTRLLTTAPGHTRLPLYLSLVRLNVQQGREESAQLYINFALDSIRSHVDAEFLFEDCKFIFTDEELGRFDNLITVAQKQQFFREFWTRRDPTVASPINYRALEHFRRLSLAEQDYWYDGVRSSINNPDRLAQLKFPRTHLLNHELNDKGLVYVRHGDPDDTARTGGTVTTNESWHYYRRQDRPEYIFHFLIGRNAAGGNWRLAPYLSNRQMLADRLGWDHNLDRLYYAASAVEQNSVIHEISSVSAKQVFSALSSDSHSWSKDLQPLNPDAYGSFFRGGQGKTRVELYVCVPVSELTGSESSQPAGRFEHGATIVDRDHNRKGSRFEQLNPEAFEPMRVTNGFFVHRYTFEVEPDQYRLSFFTRLSEPEKIGGGNLNVSVPSFDSDSLRLSDLELAYEIEPRGQDSIFATGDLTIIPNASKEFALSEPLYLYFEVYNLKKDRTDQTSFEVESKLTQTRGKKFLGIFGGGKKKSISIVNSISGESSTAYEHTSFDVNKLDAGEYTLTVSVKDVNSKQSVRKSLDLNLRK